MSEIIKIPIVTILMPVYNGEKYIKESIDSILSQTFCDFIFIIIDDGSTDNSINIIKSYNEPRIKLLSNKKNLGISTSLNIAIKKSNSKYIARMDSDDISLPNRIEEQVKFMENHPDIGVCGTFIKTFGSQKSKTLKLPIKNDDIKIRLLFQNPLAHPTVMIRKKVLDINNLKYDSNYNGAEDYELWVRLIEKTIIWNLPKTLIRYRLHEKNISKINFNTQKYLTEKIITYQLKKLDITPSEEELKIHQMNFSNLNYSKKELIKKEEEWLIKLINSNKSNKIYPENKFIEFIIERWLKIYLVNTKLEFDAWKTFWKYEIIKNIKSQRHILIFKLTIKLIFKKII